MSLSFRGLTILALLAGAQGCSPPSEIELSPPLAWFSDEPDTACKSGLKLRMTGICTDDDRAKVDAAGDAEPAPDCEWRLAEVPLSTRHALIFRVTTCGEPAIRINGKLKPVEGPSRIRAFTSYPAWPHAEGNAGDPPVHRVFWLSRGSVGDIEYALVTLTLLPPDKTAEEVALSQLPSCTVVPRDDVNLSGKAFALEPSDGANTCHPEDIWEARPGFVLRHLDHGRPKGIDPLSYTLYARDGAGHWAQQH